MKPTSAYDNTAVCDELFLVFLSSIQSQYTEWRDEEVLALKLYLLSCSVVKLLLADLLI